MFNFSAYLSKLKNTAQIVVAKELKASRSMYYITSQLSQHLKKQTKLSTSMKNPLMFTFFQRRRDGEIQQGDFFSIKVQSSSKTANHKWVEFDILCKEKAIVLIKLNFYKNNIFNTSFIVHDQQCSALRDYDYIIKYILSTCLDLLGHQYEVNQAKIEKTILSLIKETVDTFGFKLQQDSALTEKNTTDKTTCLINNSGFELKINNIMYISKTELLAGVQTYIKISLESESLNLRVHKLLPITNNMVDWSFFEKKCIEDLSELLNCSVLP